MTEYNAIPASAFRVRGMRGLYSLISYLLLPWALTRLFMDGLRNPAYRQGWRQRFGFIPRHEDDQPVLWLHAVSVGEVQGAAPLIRRLLTDFRHCRIVVTTMTPTGAEMVAQQFGRAVQHFYLPYDIPPAVTRFVTRLQPTLLVLMETELWPNLLRACRRHGIPVMLANARMSERSAAGYARFATLTRAMLADIDRIAAQSQADADRLQRLGAAADRIVVTGNLKFDVELPPGVIEQGRALRRWLGTQRPVWIAASTHEGEEEHVLDAFAEVRRQYPDCLLILAPRHPERSRRVVALCRKRAMTLVRRSRNEPVTPATCVYLIDGLGELPTCYAAADVAFVGGSLVAAGGHNMLEPAALNIPVVCGPHCFNFSEVLSMLQSAGAASVVEDASGLRDCVLQLLAHPEHRHDAGAAGRAAVTSQRGRVDNVLALLRDYLVVNRG